MCYFACYLFFSVRNALQLQQNQTNTSPKKQTRPKRQHSWVNTLMAALFLVAVPIAISQLGNHIALFQATDERGGIAATEEMRQSGFNEADNLKNMPFMQDGKRYVDGISFDFALKTLIYTPADATVGNQTIRAMWKGMVLGANSIIVFLFAVYGIRIMLGATGLRYAEAIETLPRIVLAIIGANISIAFVAFIIMLGNALSIGVYGFTDDTGLASDEARSQLAEALNGEFQGEITIQTIIVTILKIIVQMLFAPIFALIVEPIFAAISLLPFIEIEAPDFLSNFGIVTAILFIVTLILMFLILIQSIVRLALLNMLIVISPLGMIAWALPNGMGNGIFRFWLNALVATTFTQFLQLTCYIAGRAFFQSIGYIEAAADLAGADIGMISRIAAFWLCLRIPGWLSNSVTSTMGQASQNTLAVTNQAIMAGQAALQTAVTAVR
jgi:hypothetical protein